MVKKRNWNDKVKKWVKKYAIMKLFELCRFSFKLGK